MGYNLLGRNDVLVSRTTEYSRLQQTECREEANAQAETSFLMEHLMVWHQMALKPRLIGSVSNEIFRNTRLFHAQIGLRSVE